MYSMRAPSAISGSVVRIVKPIDDGVIRSRLVGFEKNDHTRSRSAGTTWLAWSSKAVIEVHLAVQCLYKQYIRKPSIVKQRVHGL